jgi:hypothetical protein
MRRPLLTIALAALCVGCGDPTGPEAAYQGSFSGSFVFTSVGRGGGGQVLTCRYRIDVTGTVELKLDASGTTAAGDGTVRWTETPVVTPIDQVPGCSQYSQGPSPRTFDVGGAITGTPSELHLSGGYSSTQAITTTIAASFTGALANGVVTGQVTLSHSGSGTITVTTASGTETTQITESASGSQILID